MHEIKLKQNLKKSHLLNIFDLLEDKNWSFDLLKRKAIGMID